jgi:hypothetical protein
MRFCWVLLLLAGRLAAQDDMQGMPMPGMQMPGMQMPPMNTAAQLLMGQASGTSENPGTMPMISHAETAWNLMAMGNAFVVDTQQTGPRGHDKVYSTNWAMGMAGHAWLGGAIQFETMLSLEPATITNRSYPELFQTGETAYGKPLVDAQHPHDFLMSVSVDYAHTLGEHWIWQIYYAPVGDPALGPVAYPHRTSASEIPQAPLGHHWQDSTHIADNVVTAALNYRMVRVEASGFYGTEPDENRWHVDWGPINSWSSRVSIAPSRHWNAQVSMGRLARPERQSPGDVVRSTASVEYVRDVRGNSWATSAIWGRNHDILTQHNLNSYLLESVLPLSKKNFLTGRAELVDKDELDVPLAVSIFRIGAYTLGYTRDIGTFQHIETGVGVNGSLYSMPSDLKPFYGSRPAGVNVFARFRIR